MGLKITGKGGKRLQESSKPFYLPKSLLFTAWLSGLFSFGIPFVIAGVSLYNEFSILVSYAFCVFVFLVLFYIYILFFGMLLEEILKANYIEKERK